MAYYVMDCRDCGAHYDMIEFAMADIFTERVRCPKCDSTDMRQDYEAKVKTVAIETEDTFGIGGHYNIHTGKFQTRLENRAWAKEVEAKAKAEGKECYVGKDHAGPRASREEKIADDISKHGAPAIDHYSKKANKPASP